MSKSIRKSSFNEVEESTKSLTKSSISRKDFFKYVGVAGAAVGTMGLIGCEDDEGGIDPDPNAVFLGEGDIGVLNYAYALEQLEAAFYSKVVGSFYSGASAEEKDILTNIRDHEVVHFDFFNAILTAEFPDAAIPILTPDFSAVDFSSKSSVLTTALRFENLGVAAYNGAASKLTNPQYLLAAGKIVSVEGRHCTAISDIALPNVGVTQAKIFGTSIINNSGLDLAFPVDKVLSIAGDFIVEDIDASGIIS